MFVKVKRCKNKDGSLREYLLLYTAKREGKKVKQITLANLGRLDSKSTQKSIPARRQAGLPVGRQVGFF